MIGRLNHIAIAVPDLDKATELYRTVMGAKVSAPKAQPAHGVTVVFVELPNTKIELLHPLGEKSPIANFLARNADGGIHHVCYEVEDIYAARDKLKAGGARVLGDGEPKIGAHDKPVLFLHPKDFTGTLIELEQVLGLLFVIFLRASSEGEAGASKLCTAKSGNTIRDGGPWATPMLLPLLTPPAPPLGTSPASPGGK